MTSALDFLPAIKTDFRSLARILTYVENDLPSSGELLKELAIDPSVPVVGITGPPGAGKSTLINALVNLLSAKGKRVAILAVDPTSPFNFGSLLGDRIRMTEQFTRENVFIRSLATRGSLGGLSAKTIEMVDVLRAAGFDYIIVETVGVGQSEVEIAGLADITFVMLVPGAGDEIQDMKSGVMEIADAFIINKADREGTEACINSLKKYLHLKPQQIPVFKTIADRGEGIDEIAAYLSLPVTGNRRKVLLIAEKAWKLIEAKRMAGISKESLRQRLEEEMGREGFNLYKFVEELSAIS